MTWEQIATLALVRLELAILVYFLIVNGFYAAQLLVAAWTLRSHRLAVWQESRWRILGSEVAPTISVLAPAFNEEATIVESLHSLLTLRYRNLEIVVINDGSKDRTVEVLKDAFDLVSIHPIYQRLVDHQPVRAIYRSRSWPGLVVVDKENGGKADALNAGLNIASGELVCAIDADTLIEPDALQKMVRPFLYSDSVVAAGGTIRIANEGVVRKGRMVEVRVPRAAVPGFQVVEYLRAFLFGRLGWNHLGGNLIISGAFGLFRRDAMLAVGGYLHGTVGEDMEIVVRLRRREYEAGTRRRVDFVPDPVAWTEAPDRLRVLSRQRERWHRGLAEVLWKHRGLFFNPRYRALGLFVYPFFVLVELLAPLVEVIGLLGLLAGLIIGSINVPFAIVFFLVAYGLGILLSLATVLMEEFSYRAYSRRGDRGRLLLWAALENLGYRQLTVLWRIRGLIGFLRKRKSWGTMERRGFARPTPPVDNQPK